MVNWDDIDTVLLDMDGTLLDLHFDNYFWLEYLPVRYAQHHACEVDAARALLTQLSDSLHGSLDWYCLDHWSREVRMDIHALKQEIRHLIRMRPHSADFLAFLRETGKQPVLVTNAHPQALALKLDASGLSAHVDTCISAHDYKLAKENAGFWHALHEDRGFDYARSLFLDDNLNVLRRARAEGVSNAVQMLHPDSSQAPREPSEFPGVRHFDELMKP